MKWLVDPAGGISQSMLVGVGIWAAFAYLWTIAPARGVQRGDAFAAFGLGGLGGIVGARLMWLIAQGRALEGYRWLDMLNPLGAGYSSMGFLAGAGLVILAMTECDFFEGTSRRSLLDLVVPAGLLGLAFARLGCIFNGCDFGKVTESGWFAIRYAQGSLAWQQHAKRGLIESTDAWSMPTHAFPLYSALVTIMVVVWVSVGSCRPNERPRPAGKIALRAIVAFCMAQILLEFLRETWAAGSLTACTPNQIALTGALLIVSTVRIYQAYGNAKRKRSRDV